MDGGIALLSLPELLHSQKEPEVACAMPQVVQRGSGQPPQKKARTVSVEECAVGIASKGSVHVWLASLGLPGNSWLDSCALALARLRVDIISRI